jgi:mono/diheme cytochrome c family protein
MIRLAASFVVSALVWAASASAQPKPDSLVEQGRYLAILGDCSACHTAPGGAELAGGSPIETPFGKLVPPNITPDKATGIGNMTDAEFLKVFHEGIAPRGHLYPGFPYPYYTKVSDADVLAIRAWLNTLPAVSHAVTANQLPFPFDIRANMIAWNELYFTPGRFAPVAGKSEIWNRGAYIVEGLGHCGACHTAKTALGGDDDKKRLQGGVLDQWFAPNLTGDVRSGVGGWSIDEITLYLKSGHNAYAAATGPMAEVVSQSTSRMKDSDLLAIATYLKDQPGQPLPPVKAVDAATMQEGEAVFADHCTACHRPDGTGVDGLAPALAHRPRDAGIRLEIVGPSDRWGHELYPCELG